ncbi:MAG: hypothetical protein Tsb0016_10950 [Sphingomonadales bacterium]
MQSPTASINPIFMHPRERAKLHIHFLFIRGANWCGFGACAKTNPVPIRPSAQEAAEYENMLVELIRHVNSRFR